MTAVSATGSLTIADAYLSGRESVSSSSGQKTKKLGCRLCFQVRRLEREAPAFRFDRSTRRIIHRKERDRGKRAFPQSEAGDLVPG